MAITKRWTWINRQSALAAFGACVVIVGATVDRDRANLALALVGFGVLLVVLAVLLPRLESISAKLPGIGEVSANLTPAATSVSDRALAPAGRPERDLRGTSPYTSNADDFRQAITGGPATYVTINLEDGKAWLSSRLYVFVSALAEVRGIGAVVFTSRSDRIDTFAGVCSVDVVLARLAWAYPWLPAALADAWKDMRSSDPHRAPPRRMAADEAAALFAKYVDVLQRPPFPPVSASQPVPEVPPLAGVRSIVRAEEWQDLGGIWEHANWLDTAAVSDLMGEGLTKDFIVGTSDATEIVQAALAASGQYIAVLSDRNEVQSVINRSKLLARLLLAQGIAAGPR